MADLMDAPGRWDSKQLLAGARAGDADCLGRLLEIYRNYLHLLASAKLNDRLRSRVSPSDLVQETFLRASRHFGEFCGSSEQEWLGWPRTILRRSVLKNEAGSCPGEPALGPAGRAGSASAGHPRRIPRGAGARRPAISGRLSAGPLTIGVNLTIDGLGASKLTVSGGGTQQVFIVSAGVTATIDKLTIANGLAVQGGGIDNFGLPSPSRRPRSRATTPRPATTTSMAP
jgi:hypothetical protein